MWFAIILWCTRYRVRAAVALAVVAPLAFVALPDSLQNRFETIINPDVGPASAKESGSRPKLEPEDPDVPVESPEQRCVGMFL